MNPLDAMSSVAPQPVAVVTITMMADSQVSVQVQSSDPMAVFMAIGSALSQLSAEYKKRQMQTIQIAPAGLLGQIPN